MKHQTTMRCPCGAKKGLDWCRRFADGLQFIRCPDCRRKGGFVIVPEADLTVDQTDVRSEMRNLGRAD